MRRIFFFGAGLLLWLVAYADWLEPGWLRYGVPAKWNKPLQTETVYDVGLCARRSMKRAAIDQIEEIVPDWMEFWNWGEEQEESSCFKP